ncbi:4'-phosphopantetheinyl transferase [Candidatus Riflebacteria bacterium]
MFFLNPFPEFIGFACISHNEVDKKLIFATEKEALSRGAVEKRCLDFFAGRQAAHLAMQAINMEPCPIPVGEKNEPLWPENITGSISHSCGIALAAVALKANVRLIGVDLEDKMRRLQNFSRILQMVCCYQAEKKWVLEEKNPAAQQVRFLQVFSAKEAFYKAFFPIFKQRFFFNAVEMLWEDSCKGFSGEIKLEFPGNYNRGFKIKVHSKFVNSFILSSLFLPA